MYGAVYAALRSAEDAEEVTQDAFVGPSQGCDLPRRRVVQHLGPDNRMARALTRRRRNLWWLRRDPTVDLAFVADRGAGPEDQAVFGDLRRNLRRLIADLRPRLRDVLLLEQVVNTATRRLPRWSVARSEP